MKVNRRERKKKFPVSGYGYGIFYQIIWVDSTLPILTSRHIPMTYTQNDSLVELTKKIEILNTPLDIDKKKDITILNTIASSDNEKTNRHVRNTICHKCKEYGHTKNQCVNC